jgi:hypothetical protein
MRKRNAYVDVKFILGTDPKVENLANGKVRKFANGKVENLVDGAKVKTITDQRKTILVFSR